MSSVESILPMLGVNSLVFHGNGLPNIGMPLTICCGLPRPTGAKMITSYFALRFASFATSCVLM
ncbi:MAG: hypothetical protein JMDDDDMK_02090 [Acidobacteria bacterium]|nr:hypothetical protein [Acidobacteriota bacterium]